MIVLMLVILTAAILLTMVDILWINIVLCAVVALCCIVCILEDRDKKKRINSLNKSLDQSLQLIKSSTLYMDRIEKDYEKILQALKSKIEKDDSK